MVRPGGRPSVRPPSSGGAGDAGPRDPRGATRADPCGPGPPGLEAVASGRRARLPGRDSCESRRVVRARPAARRGRPPFRGQDSRSCALDPEPGGIRTPGLAAFRVVEAGIEPASWASRPRSTFELLVQRCRLPMPDRGTHAGQSRGRRVRRRQAPAASWRNLLQGGSAPSGCLPAPARGQQKSPGARAPPGLSVRSPWSSAPGKTSGWPRRRDGWAVAEQAPLVHRFLAWFRHRRLRECRARRHGARGWRRYGRDSRSFSSPEKSFPGHEPRPASRRGRRGSWIGWPPETERCA